MVDQVYIYGLLRKLQQAGHSTVLRCRGQDISGDGFLASIFRYAKVLRAMDVGRDNLLGMFAPNRPDALALRYAAQVLGVATVYLSMPSNEVQRRSVLKQMAPDLLVVFPETAECLDANTDIPFATIGTDKAGSRGRLDIPAAAEPADPVPVMAVPSDLGVIASSGGSTGVPKGSCRSFAAYSAMVGAPSPKDRIQLINGPLAYLSQVLVDITLLGGGRAVFRHPCEA